MTNTNHLQGLLKVTYGLVPIIAGLDKFTNLLTNWASYLNLKISSILPFDASMFLKIVGILEIIAGLIVLIRPRIGAYLVMVWLICIALQLIIGGHYFDIAVRDLVMATGAYTLAKLTKIELAVHRQFYQGRPKTSGAASS